MDRAYSVLTVKAVSEDERVIRGIATTPATDRVGDIVEPLGVKFANPLPLLHQHDAALPVGTVRFDKPTKDGITFEARLPKVTEPASLKDRIDTAWAEIKAGLVRGVSIGFRAIETSRIADGGIRFVKSEVFELSLVTIPANQQATITTIKSIDAKQRAVSGHHARGAIEPRTPQGQPKQSRAEGAGTMKTVADRIAEMEAKRAAKAAAMETIMNKSFEEGRDGLDADESETYDDLAVELKEIDVTLSRLNALAKAQNGAKAVDGTGTKKAAETRQRVTQMRHTMDPGIAFARVAKCLAIAHLKHSDAVRVAENLYGNDGGIVSAVKAVVDDVPAGTTHHPTWAGPLVGDETSAFADFVEYLRPTTIVGRFGTNGVPSLRRVPFRVALVGQTSGGSASWVGEGQSKPLTKFDYARRTLEPLKLATIAVLTEEVIRDSSPSAETIVRDQLAEALRAQMDEDFIDPANGGNPGVAPASITNGLGGNSIISGGNSADAVRDDVRRLMALFVAANNAPSTGVWIMSQNTALALSILVNMLGQTEFSGINMGGGTFFGLPVITSEHVPTSNGASVVALVNAGDIYLGDEGGIAVDMSREASLSMSSTVGVMSSADGSPPVPVPAELVSMFQTNSVAFRAERTINWSRRRDSGVALLTAVSWGQPEGSP